METTNEKDYCQTIKVEKTNDKPLFKLLDSVFYMEDNKIIEDFIGSIITTQSLTTNIIGEEVIPPIGCSMDLYINNIEYTYITYRNAKSQKDYQFFKTREELIDNLLK